MCLKEWITSLVAQCFSNKKGLPVLAGLEEDQIVTSGTLKKARLQHATEPFLRWVLYAHRLGHQRYTTDIGGSD